MIILRRLLRMAFIFLLFLKLSSLLTYGNTFEKADTATVLDLRKASFSSNINLDSHWTFYWNQLIYPNQISRPDSIVSIPFIWNNHQLHSKQLPSFGYATYQLTVLLPKNSGSLKLCIPDVYTAYRLFVNGKEAAKNGVVSTNVKDFIPYWEYKMVNVPEGADTLRLILQIANFVHHNGGIAKPLTIGKSEAIDLERNRANAIDLLLTGCLLVGGLFFLGLYLFGNRDKAILLFALYAMVYSYRTAGADNYALHTILPHLNWYLTVRLEYISLFAGVGLFGFYCRYLYPEDQHPVVVFGVGSVCLVFSLATILLPPVYFTQLITPFLLVAIFCLVYVPVLYIIAWRNKRPGSVFALASAFALMFVFSITLLHYWNLIPQMQFLSFVGYLCFFFLQSLVLSHRVSFTLKKAGEQASQGLTAKSEFLSTMSHEIRTPLNSVVGMSHLLLRNDPRPDQIEHLNGMVFSANNLLNIVNDILDYSKIEAGKVSFEHIEMDIGVIAGNIVTSLQVTAQDKGIYLKLEVDKKLKNKVIGDPTRTTQVITNLVHNAIKFTSFGGVNISIMVSSQTADNISLLINVKDTGIGISPEKQILIFERFTQADSSTSRGFGGTGLGLSISKRILELQGTSLQLSSEESRGSNFYFTQQFPLGGQLITHVPNKSNAVKDPLAFVGINILLVEDNPMNVMVAQTFLKRWGASVDVAVNGQEALDKLDIKKHQLILMDLHMPVLDGYEATKRMRENGVSLPIVALTAALPSEIQEKVKETGIDDIVVKPFLPDELYKKVFYYISQKKFIF